MLALIQVMTYMIAKLDYKPSEVHAVFSKVEAGEITCEGLLHAHGLGFDSDLPLQMMKRSLPRWKSALLVVTMRLGVEQCDTRM